MSAKANLTANYRPVQQLNGRRIYVRKKTMEIDVNKSTFFNDGWDPENMATNAAISTILLSGLLVCSNLLI